MSCISRHALPGDRFPDAARLSIGFYLNWDRPICRLAVLVISLLWLVTTFMPGDQFAMLAAGFVVTARPACSTISIIPDRGRSGSRSC